MQLQCKSFKERTKADVLIIPFWKEKKNPKIASHSKKLPPLLHTVISSGDFKGANGDVLLTYLEEFQEKRVLLLGLGEEKKISLEALRCAYAAAIKYCMNYQWKTLNCCFPLIDSIESKDAIFAASEGAMLANYLFDRFKQEESRKKTALVKKLSWVDASTLLLKEAKKTLPICEGVYYARDLVNLNANIVTPEYLAKEAKEIARKYASVKTRVWTKKQIEKENLGLLLAVSKGASVEPRFIVMEYQGAPKSKEKIAIIGKGVTYDTGGLNLKGTGSIETMKSDMAGAAAAFGTFVAAVQSKLKVNLTLVVAAAENVIGSRSYKPGDVYTGFAGISVEIGNTDAEGRLILADALAYTVKKIKPSKIIDLATLTGAILVALGQEVTGMFSNNEELAKQLYEAGQESYERVWRLPLYEEYESQLKSDIADTSNIGGRLAGSITAGLFLQKFVSKVPWVHLDIAGTAYLSKEKRYHPKNATGVGVRLLMKFLTSGSLSSK